jgi:hypothetical protein
MHQLELTVISEPRNKEKKRVHVHKPSPVVDRDDGSIITWQRPIARHIINEQLNIRFHGPLFDFKDYQYQCARGSKYWF